MTSNKPRLDVIILSNGCRNWLYYEGIVVVRFVKVYRFILVRYWFVFMDNIMRLTLSTAVGYVKKLEVYFCHLFSIDNTFGIYIPNRFEQFWIDCVIIFSRTRLFSSLRLLLSFSSYWSINASFYRWWIYPLRFYCQLFLKI